MIWYSGVCKCYIEYEPRANGTLGTLLLTRACEFHKDLDGKPELFDMLRAEGGTASNAVEAIKAVDSAAEVVYAYDADRKLTIDVRGSAVAKAALQAAVNAAIGSGKAVVA